MPLKTGYRPFNEPRCRCHERFFIVDAGNEIEEFSHFVRTVTKKLHCLNNIVNSLSHSCAGQASAPKGQQPRKTLAVMRAVDVRIVRGGAGEFYGPLGDG